MTYTVSKELENLGNAIIAKDRPKLAMLKIAYMFRPEAAITGGKLVAGKTVKVDPRNYTLHQTDFIIEIAQDVWLEATPEFRDALMDHELGHVGVKMDENGDEERDEDTNRIKVVVNMHDIEEFEDVLARHGAYHAALRSFLKKFQERKEAAKAKPDEPAE